MNPIPFSEANLVFHPAPGTEKDVVPLHVHATQSQIISCWEPSDDELKEIVKTRRVWFSMFTNSPPPPILLMGHTPFKSEECAAFNCHNAKEKEWHLVCQACWERLPVDLKINLVDTHRDLSTMEAEAMVHDDAVKDVLRFLES